MACNVSQHILVNRGCGFQQQNPRPGQQECILWKATHPRQPQQGQQSSTCPGDQDVECDAVCGKVSKAALRPTHLVTAVNVGQGVLAQAVAQAQGDHTVDVLGGHL